MSNSNERRLESVTINPIMMIIYLTLMVTALVVGFIHYHCLWAGPQVTWLLVFGFMIPIIITAFFGLLCLTMTVIFTIPAAFAFILLPFFPLAWTIYGCVIFFPKIAIYSTVLRL